VALVLDRWKLVTLDSGEPHAIAASGYNERRHECARACELLGIDSLRDATLEMAAGLQAPLSLRVQHVMSENARVEQAVGALERRDLPELGRLLDASHQSLRDCYEVSTPAVEAAVARLERAGAAGARIIGGGFGGHVLGLMPPGSRLPEGAVVVAPGAGARLLD
jgi:galactokinase